MRIVFQTARKPTSKERKKERKKEERERLFFLPNFFRKTYFFVDFFFLIGNSSFSLMFRTDVRVRNGRVRNSKVTERYPSNSSTPVFVRAFQTSTA